MEDIRTRYPGYDLLKEQKEWDPHTREVVLKRLGPFPKPKFLQENEVQMLKIIANHLVYDNRSEITDWVIHHIDQSLTSNIGEGQRAPKAPQAKDLIRWGLQAINKVATIKYKAVFLGLDEKQQFGILAAIQNGKAEAVPEWAKVPQKELFKKLAAEIVSAYYSHPTVWSEIGYGGPAYTRGYVRVEIGLTDPWEAKSDAKQ